MSKDLHEPEELQTPDIAERLYLEAEARETATHRIGTFPASPDAPVADASTMYFREIAQHDILTAQQEVALAQQMEAGRAAASELAAGGECLGDRRFLLEQRRLEGEYARHRLIECNLRLVVSVARRYLRRGVAFMDLVQEGNVGLQIGIDKYDWRRGFRLSTYIYWWIRQAMSRAVMEQGRIIRLPVHTIELLTRVARAERELVTQLGRQPTTEELARCLDLEPERIGEARRAAQMTLSLDVPVGEDGEVARGDLIADQAATDAVYRSYEASELSDGLEAALAELQPIERHVLRQRFGLDRDNKRTLRELGHELGLSNERVRQIQATGLAKLRQMRRLRRDVLPYAA